MGSEQRIESGLSSRMVFQDDSLHFPRAGGKPSVPGFALDGDRMLSDDRDGRFVRTQAMNHHHHPQTQRWSLDGDTGSQSGDESDDDDDDADLDEGDGEVDGLVSVSVGDTKHNNNNNSSSSVQSSSEKIQHCGEAILHDRQTFGLSRGAMAKDGNAIRGILSEQQHQQERVCSYENAVTVVEPGLYCLPFLNGGDGPALAQKELGEDNGYGFTGRKESGLSFDHRESLRAHLSDPITGVLMDDAMILSCGHSFGSNGMQHIFRMKACYKCSQPISDGSVRPNLSLRSAVQAFCREEESHSARASKRRRDRFDQDKCCYDDSFPMDSRGKGVQFPFAVSDRVIIKGNKRTPQRFVGRTAVVTTQCLNGWYVVKTSDNAESVKLQYRSLAKVSDDSSSNMVGTSKSISSNWL